MLAAQPCEEVAEKVSLVTFACSVLEGASHSRYMQQANGARPRKRRPSITSCADVFASIGVKIRETIRPSGWRPLERFYPLFQICSNLSGLTNEDRETAQSWLTLHRPPPAWPDLHGLHVLTPRSSNSAIDSDSRRRCRRGRETRHSLDTTIGDPTIPSRRCASHNKRTTLRMETTGLPSRSPLRTRSTCQPASLGIRPGRIPRSHGSTYGTHLIESDQWYPSSETCSECGHHNTALGREPVHG